MDSKASLNDSELLNVLSHSNNPTAIYTSGQLIIEFANDAMLGFWGKDSSVVGKPLEEGVPELKGHPLKKMIRQVLKTGEAFVGTIAPQMLIDGRVQTNYYEYQYRPVKNNAGQVYAVLHTAVNVTDKIAGQQAVERESGREVILFREQLLNEELSAANEELKVANDELKLTQENLRLLNERLEDQVERRTGELSESEIRFRSMAESSGILIAVSDETRNFTYFNKAWLELTGRPITHLLGFGWTDLVHPNDRSNLLLAYASAFKKQQPFSIEFRIYDRNSDYTWLMCNGAPRFTFDRVFLGYVSSCMDITDMKMQEQRKDDFISIASHELKTPLTSLKATLQLLDRVKENPDTSKHVKLITQANKSMNRITSLVNDLLGYSTANEGFLPLHKTMFLLSDLVNKCCNHVRAEGKHELVLTGDMQLQVYADENRLDQVMVNLVNNAVKYAPDSREIFIEIKRLPTEAQVAVRDTGPGIPQDKIPHLFERYYRVNHTSEQYSGLGLGLYITSEIIRRHGGRIGVESTLGKGTAFWFTLPLP